MVRKNIVSYEETFQMKPQLTEERLEMDPEICSIKSEFEMFSDLFDMKALAQ